MPRNTVGGGGSHVGNPDVPLNPDAQRAIAEGRAPDVIKSAFIGVEVDRKAYDDAMSRHGTDDYTEQDKLVVENFTQQRSDQERADAEEREGEPVGARGRAAQDSQEVASSDGSTSPRSSGKPAKSGASTKHASRSTARDAEPGSSGDRTGNSPASSTDGSGTAGR